MGRCLHVFLTMLTPGRECPCEDQDIRPLAGVMKPASVTVYDAGIRSPCVGGMLSSSDIAGRLLPVGVADAPAVGGLSRFPHGFWWCWSMRPRLGALQDGSIHVGIRIYGSWLV